MQGTYGDSTRSVKATDTERLPGSPVAPYPVPAAAYHLDPAEDDAQDTYGRRSNPTWRQLESALAQLENSSDAIAFGSGMAALTAALRVAVAPGATVVVPADGYYQVRAYAREYFTPRGVTVVEARCEQMCDAAGSADVVLAETPSNPRLDVVDLHRLAMTCRARGATLIVDNTTATPLGQQPLSLGADLVVASATKALAGHHDLLAGYAAGNHPDLMERLRTERLHAGPVLGALEAWLLLRSLATFGLRFDRQCQNAAAVAVMLRTHPAVRAVRYPGIPEDPAHPVAAVQMRRFGGIVAVELADARTVHALVERSALLVASTSFGGIHSSVDRRARWGDAVPDGFARISLGIEDTEDLLADLEQALPRT
ncbi:cystathionine gamma-lyase [Mycolicibacterium duvalii]|uniref:Cystathionine gamma-lyase n=1 Tax=Mycolicibacterium duvalii TaxID=39688 RepID=A0A7I7K1M6_9MYCO|nr:cystathionine gamma-lyase [Mycolicibacterium duvalii]MCV7369794.1 cystathionine gamma-lyase [Mycolicibacterium duvalii]PEG37017.1 cystathionine gamma-lyase [Mycolicibacterium duvalii]BBX17524.1 cystathionine gamma-lyase [Mycolicibacterium duvalii]